MDTASNVLSNELDQAPKTGERYQKELNDPKLHAQIIDAFDKNSGLSGVFNLPVDDLKNLDIHQLEKSADNDMKAFYGEWAKFWEWRKVSAKKEYPDERARNDGIYHRYCAIKDKREKRRNLNGIPRVRTEQLGNSVRNLFQTFEDTVQRDYCNIMNIPFEKKLSFNENFFRFRIASNQQIFRDQNSKKITSYIKTIEQYISKYNFTLTSLRKTVNQELENPESENKSLYLQRLRSHYVESLLVCKIFMDMAKSHKDTDNEPVLTHRLQELLDEIAKIDSMKKEL